MGLQSAFDFLSDKLQFSKFLNQNCILSLFARGGSKLMVSMTIFQIGIFFYFGFSADVRLLKFLLDFIKACPAIFAVNCKVCFIR